MEFVVFRPGFDILSAGDCVSKSQVDEMFTKGSPAAIQAGVGGGIFIVASEEDPSPHLGDYVTQCLWVKFADDVPTGNIYYWNGDDWAEIFARPSYEEANVPIENLTAGEENEGKVVAIDSAGLGTAATILSLIADRTLSISKILASGNLGNVISIVEENGTQKAGWRQVADLLMEVRIPRTNIQPLVHRPTITAGTLLINGNFGDCFYVNMTEDVTAITFHPDSIEEGNGIQIRFHQSTANYYTLAADAWPAAVKWRDGIAPTIDVTQEHDTLVSILRLSAEDGETYLGVFSANFQSL